MDRHTRLGYDRPFGGLFVVYLSKICAFSKDNRCVKKIFLLQLD